MITVTLSLSLSLTSFQFFLLLAYKSTLENNKERNWHLNRGLPNRVQHAHSSPRRSHSLSRLTPVAISSVFFISSSAVCYRSKLIHTHNQSSYTEQYKVPESSRRRALFGVAHSTHLDLFSSSLPPNRARALPALSFSLSRSCHNLNPKYLT